MFVTDRKPLEISSVSFVAFEVWHHRFR